MVATSGQIQRLKRGLRLKHTEVEILGAVGEIANIILDKKASKFNRWCMAIVKDPCESFQT